MNKKLICLLGSWALAAASLAAANSKTLIGHLPEAVSKFNLKPLGRLPAAQHLKLEIGLPLRNQAVLSSFLQQLYDPGSPSFHQYLNPAQFTQQFGPTAEDYQTVVNFAAAHGLTIKEKSEDRVLLEVDAPVSTIESVFHVTLQTYQYPTEARQFFAPDVEPTVDANLPIIHISGLNNFFKQRRITPKKPLGNGQGSGGSAGGAFIGNDFRNAFVPGVNLQGSGQNVGLVEFSPYDMSDITAYENKAGLSTSFPLKNVQLSDYVGFTGTNDEDGECALDIEMVMSMAPGLNDLYVFQGGNEGTDTDTMLKTMTGSSYTQIKQFSSSWAMTADPMAEGYLMQMAAQGQTFFQASGDGDAYVGPIWWPGDDPFVTSVGGAALTMSNGTYFSEQVWNWNYNGPGAWCCNGQTTNDPYWGSGGGVSSSYSIPSWQKSVNMTAVGGSSTMRNVPDVALTSDNIWVNSDHGGAGDIGGTSCAAPLWAGFLALVNEQAANQGLPSVGFINPALYAIGQSIQYSEAFHDTIVGSNTWPNSATKYYAATGYDLCTGWGTPNGQGMMDALVGYAGPIWVNFSGACPGNGSYTNAFCALASGVSAVSSGGAICLVGPHSTSTAITITKPMTLRAFYGPVTIGQ